MLSPRGAVGPELVPLANSRTSSGSAENRGRKKSGDMPRRPSRSPVGPGGRSEGGGSGSAIDRSARANKVVASSVALPGHRRSRSDGCRGDPVAGAVRAAAAPAIYTLSTPATISPGRSPGPSTPPSSSSSSSPSSWSPSLPLSGVGGSTTEEHEAIERSLLEIDGQAGSEATLGTAMSPTRAFLVQESVRAARRAQEDARQLNRLADLVSRPDAVGTLVVPKRLEMRTFGARLSDVPVIFSAPHGVSFLDGRPRHVWEKHTHDIARMLSEQIGATYMGWTAQRRKDARKPVAGERDPNFVRRAELLDLRNIAQYPMFVALARVKTVMLFERWETRLLRQQFVEARRQAQSGGGPADADSPGSPSSPPPFQSSRAVSIGRDDGGLQRGPGGPSSSWGDASPPFTNSYNSFLAESGIHREAAMAIASARALSVSPDPAADPNSVAGPVAAAASAVSNAVSPSSEDFAEPELIAMHFDMHGCTDSYGHDLMLGVGAMTDEVADPLVRAHRCVVRAVFRDALYRCLSPVLQSVNMTVTPPHADPPLTGSLVFEDEVCGGSERLTMTQQSSALGYTSAQLEMSSRLRQALVSQPALLTAFAQALFRVYQTVSAASFR